MITQIIITIVLGAVLGGFVLLVLMLYNTWKDKKVGKLAKEFLEQEQKGGNNGIKKIITTSNGTEDKGRSPRIFTRSFTRTGGVESLSGSNATESSVHRPSTSKQGIFGWFKRTNRNKPGKPVEVEPVNNRVEPNVKRTVVLTKPTAI
jgi:hypothetical protein